MTETDLTKSHHYKLERYGIMQCDRLIKTPDDILKCFYDQITLEPKTTPFPFGTFADYLKNVLLSNSYKLTLLFDWGTIDCTSLIFDKSNIGASFDKAAIDFLPRMLYRFSEQIHNRLCPYPLMESEVAYSHFALWPLLQNAVITVPGLTCDFKVGKTLLKALDYQGAPNYNADGVVLMKEIDLGLLILETSGAYGTMNCHRHVFDHIKGAFGCYAMIVSILTKYKEANANLLEDISVNFIHTSAKERVVTYKLTLDSQDSAGIRDAIEFFWLVKDILMKSQRAVTSLMKSNNENSFDFELVTNSRTPLPTLLKPTLIKPNKGAVCDGIVDSDPISFTL
ncbi:hypothetical protein DFQ28_002324 [Apophysomyces sp. BC1034]|nr:hypothetical protein DFQ30_001039 [Apophysomyces sp. BC1015]KAG0183131.1 hypothetical protein DFQ29_009829 [Apophysomyces sp. BC1021]KAG0193960.1 hypothetical protein DFQ28_002324 [Apophysomyces sp. BC1034]